MKCERCGDVDLEKMTHVENRFGEWIYVCVNCFKKFWLEQYLGSGGRLIEE